MKLTQAILKQVLHYDSRTGTWTWRKRSDYRSQWNGRFAGKPAGSIDPDNGYLRIRVKIGDINRLYYAHRLAFLYVTGEWPQVEADHRDLDRAYCAWDNLRPATRSQNNLNHPLRSDNTTGQKGVWLDHRSGKYSAEVTINRSRYRKAGFDTIEEAAAFYKKIIRERGEGFGRTA